MNTRHSPAKAGTNQGSLSEQNHIGKNQSKTPPKKTARKSTSLSSSKSITTDSRLSQQPQDIEIGVEGDDFEIEPDEGNRIEKKKYSPRKGTVPAAPGNVDFEKPFNLGWGRELVIHGKPGSNLKHDVDVCYFSPEGKKLKTRTEIKAHLLKTQSPLTIDSFTFETETVYEEPFEIIRYTGKPKGKGKSKKPGDSEKPGDPQSSSSNKISRRRSSEKSAADKDNTKRRESIDGADIAHKTTPVKECSVALDSSKVKSVQSSKDESKDNSNEMSKSDINKKSPETKELSPRTAAIQRRSKRGSRTSVSKSLNEDDSLKKADVKLTKDKESKKKSLETDEIMTLGVEKNIVAQTTPDKEIVMITNSEAGPSGKKSNKNGSSETATGQKNVQIQQSEDINPSEGQNIEPMETAEPEGAQMESDDLGIKISSVESIADSTNLVNEVTAPQNESSLENAQDKNTKFNATKKVSNQDIISDNTVLSEELNSLNSNKDESPKLGVAKKKDAKDRMKIGHNWLRIKPKTGSVNAVDKESDQSPPVSNKQRIIGTIGSITLQKRNKSSILKPGMKFKSVNSSTATKTKPSFLPKVPVKYKDIRHANSKSVMPKNLGSKRSDDISPNKRRRTLPARLKDYAVVDAKDTESSQESETDSAAELIDYLVPDKDESEHFISNVNPSADELIRSVLGRKPGNVAKKHTGKRKRTGNDVQHLEASVPKKKKTTSQTNGADTPGRAGDRVICDLHCEGHIGTPPSLQCELCMCLYHPKCVHLQGTTLKSFTCPNCRKANPPAMGPVTIDLPSSACASVAGSQVIYVGSSAPPRFSSSSAGSNVTVVQMNTKTISASLPVASKAEPWELRKLRATKDKVNKQIVNLPQDVAKKLDFEKGLSLKYNGITYKIPPSCFETKGTSVKLLLPPDTLPNYVCKSGTDNPVSISAGRPGSNQLTMFQMNSASYTREITSANKENNVLTPQQEQRKSILASLFPQQPAAIDDPIEIAMDFGAHEPPPPGSSVQKAKRTGRFKSKAKRKPVAKTTKYTQPTCNFQMLHVGFDCMLNIFEYLKLPDLIRASEVCRTWQRVASQSSLWRRVRLRGYRITNWQAAITCFQERNTRIMDLRGMLHPNDDANTTWQEMYNELQQLACVRHLDLPQCPASVLHAITEKLGMIQHIAAESIIETVTDPMSSNAKLDLGKFAKLTRLEVLKLRGSVGLVQPSFSFSGGLSELSNLAHLHTLCVTTLRDLPGSEFSFLGNLTNLHTLSIGDCNLWTPQNFEDLGKLEKLKFLRLESGGHLKEASLGKALEKMSRLESLELFKFVMSFDLADSLQTLASLRTFSMFSETNSQAAVVNSNTMTALENMPFLTTVQWGIFDSGDANSTIPPDSIPVMPSGGASGGKDKRTINLDDINPEYVKVNDLVKRLSDHLTDTVMRVFRVPNVSARRPPPTTS